MHHAELIDLTGKTPCEGGKQSESEGMTKILIQNEFFGNSNLSNDLKLASQAYDEGSIPFTRSNEINDLMLHQVTGA